MDRDEPQIACDDFNAIRVSDEKSSTNFDVRLSGKFNDFINDHHLIELKLPHRNFTWASGANKALLDRSLVNGEWIDKYPQVNVQHLSTYGSDHIPLLLSTGVSQSSPHCFRFDPEWLKNEEFTRLVVKWQTETPLSEYRLGLSWHKKIKTLKRKITGWAKNYYRKKKRTKQTVLDQIQRLEDIKDERDLTGSEK